MVLEVLLSKCIVALCLAKEDLEYSGVYINSEIRSGCDFLF